MNKQRNNKSTKDKTRTYEVKRNSKKSDRFDSKRELSTNDPKWYASDSALLRDSATIPFSWAIGTPFSYGNKSAADLDMNQFDSIPGLAVQYLIPSIGRTDFPNDPVNVAANSMYSFVRHANSGHSNYNSPDLMLYTLAMSQVYSYINFLQRAYGVMTLFSQRNRYMPEIVCEAMGLNYDSLKTNLAAFRYYINVFINKAASMAVPNNMSIFERHAFLYQNIYTGGASAKDQLYMYAPRAFWKFQWNKDNSAGELQTYEFWDGLTTKTLDDLIEYGENLLNPIIRSEDMNIMSGDILKAYGDSGIIKLAALPEYYPLTPIYDIAFLEQFKNATIVNCAHVPTFTVSHSEDVGYLVHKPQAVITIDVGDLGATMITKYVMSMLTENRIFTTLAPDPTPELIMENSRLMVACNNYDMVLTQSEDEADYYYADLICGTEVACDCRLYKYEFDKTGTVRRTQYVNPRYNMSVDSRDPQIVLDYIKMLNYKSSFKFAPAMRLVLIKDGTTQGAIQLACVGINYDVDNYAILDAEDVHRMHDTALLNLLNVPAVAKFR